MLRNASILCVTLASLAIGCGADDGPSTQLSGGGVQRGGMSTPGTNGGGDPAERDPEQTPEAEPESVHDFLYRGLYLRWPGEVAPRGSDPHGLIRRYQNELLNDAIYEQANVFPVGSSAVLEYVDADSGEVTGWAAMVKVAENEDRFDWYYYETFDPEPEGKAYIEGEGAPLCADCHVNGVDYIY